MKLLSVGILAGLMAAAIAVAGDRTDGPPGRAGMRNPSHTAQATVLDHCRTITDPDPACEAAWDAERRRFFRQTGR